jgi:hypothetical protein
MSIMTDGIYKKEEVIVHEAPVVPQEYRLLSRLVYFLVDVIEIILGLRFLLKALGANANGFVTFIYRISQPLVNPFLGIFPAAGGGGMVLEWATLLAMAVYALLAMLVVRLFLILLIR